MGHLTACTFPEIPAADCEVLPGVPWGEEFALFTPAYWYSQYCTSANVGRERYPHRIGNTIAEEITACVLGGYGMPAEIGIAAFERLKSSGVIEELCSDRNVLEQLLVEPLTISNRRLRYRFWRTKARCLASIYSELRCKNLPEAEALPLRSTLLSMPGIGPKTASWIVRNWLNSNDVAILDIHVFRAGLLMGLYKPQDRVDRDYFALEKKFLDLATKMNIPAADLDALIWSSMRSTPRLVSRMIGELLGGSAS